MGGVVLKPADRELVGSIVRASLGQAFGVHPEPGGTAPLTCELREFAVTTPSTLLYWDATVDVEWLLKAGDREKVVTATGIERTWVWPSASVIKRAVLKALEPATADTTKAVAELVAPPGS